MSRTLQMLLTAWLTILAAPLSTAAGGPADAWNLPEPGVCEPTRGVVSANGTGDAAPVPFSPGQVIDFEQLSLLRDFLPDVLWTYRDRFFYEGMRLEIGPCFRDYSPPDFFSDATRAHGRAARLEPNGGLVGHVAGLPFVPASIDPGDLQAGLKWAWNFEKRYQAAGFRGEFRITDLLGLVGRAEPFDGEIFKMQLSRRADQPNNRVAYAGAHLWVAGGMFHRPFNAREFAWRQFRDAREEADASYVDELHAYVPTLRRVRRLNASHVEGLYLPSFSVGFSQGTESLAGSEAGSATSGHVGTIHAKRSGFEGLTIKPHLYRVTLLGLHDVLTPINSNSAMYPREPDRQYGPWGLSLANDRWDLRRALVLELALRSRRFEGQESRIVYHVDLQTLHPLYYVSLDRRGEVVDVGVFAGRWSEDRADYPRWPDDPARPVRVIDSVAAAFANIDMRGSWRRESGQMVSLPPDDEKLRKMVSVAPLTRGH